MYLQNKYTKWYYNIIYKAKSRISSNHTYNEIHHIIPKSLGGNDLKENLIKLTAREHYLCHLLLTKMTTGLEKRSMDFALWLMINKKKHTSKVDAYDYIVNSRVYQRVRENVSAELSIIHKGKILTQETKDKISKSHTGKKLSEDHKSKISPKGRILSQETKDKISKGQRGRVSGMQDKQHSQETKDKISASNKGKIRKPLSTQRKDEISKQFSGTIQSEEHISKRLKSRQENGYYKDRNSTIEKISTAAKNRPKYKCHCETECTASNFKRWHGDNCKVKVSN